ncbi:MAG: hypothetical protein J6K88_02285 [Oscillospiraceae bacterium]|nr:hypothetical protein [Oscillospiraceae bacterium]
MAEIKDIKAARRKRNSKKAIRRLIVLAVAFVIIIGAVILRESISKENLTASVSDFFSSFGSGEGFPLTVPGSRTVQAQSLNSGTAVLTQTQFFVYNKTGKELQSSVHGFSNPLMARSGNKTVVYDRGGNGIKVYSKTKQLFSYTFENTIYGVEMSDKYIAVITASQTHSSEVIVFTNTYKERMKWYCAEGRVTSIAFDDFSSEIYAAVVDAENGGYVSSVYKIDVAENEEKGSIKLQGMLAMSLKKINGSVTVIGDERIDFLSSDLENMGSYSYGGKALVSLSDKMNETIVLALSDSENDRGGVIVTLNNKGEESAKIAVSEDITAVDCYKNYIAYLSASKLNIYNIRTGKSEFYETDLDAFSVTAGKDGVYTLGVTKIEKQAY